MTKRLYLHFNPEVYKIESKIATVRTSHHCKYMSINNLALEIIPDHLHLFVGAKPTVTPFKIIRKLKGNTSIQLRRCFPELRYLGYKQHFGRGFDNLWARGYYCGSAGHVSQEQVKRPTLDT